MNKTIKNKKQFSTSSLVIAAIVTSLLTIASFYAVYWSATSPKPWTNPNCYASDTYTLADGIVIKGEATAKCADEADTLKIIHTISNVTGKTVAIASSVLNLLFLIILLKVVRSSDE